MACEIQILQIQADCEVWSYVIHNGELIAKANHFINSCSDNARTFVFLTEELGVETFGWREIQRQIQRKGYWLDGVGIVK